MKTKFLLATLLLGLSIVSEAGEIRFQKYGYTTRFHGNGFSGSIQEDGFGGGRIRYDDNCYQRQPQYQLFVPIDTTPKYGANVPLFAPRQRAYNAPFWVR